MERHEGRRDRSLAILGLEVGVDRFSHGNDESTDVQDADDATRKSSFSPGLGL